MAGSGAGQGEFGEISTLIMLLHQLVQQPDPPTRAPAGDGDEPAEGDGELATVGELYELALSEWHLTPHQINYEWTEEQLTLMFKKRHQRLTLLAEEIGKRRSGEGRGSSERSAADGR